MAFEKVLVTGADGFIGSHLVEALVRRGTKVRALVYYNSVGSWGWLERVDRAVLRDVEVIAGDIRDCHAVDRLVQGCDAILHLAALIGIPYSYIAPEAYVDVNIGGTLNVIQAARRHSVAKVVSTSTSEVYGTAQIVPIPETHPLVGQSPYAATKIGADQLALSFHKSLDLPVALVRPFNTYGPRQSARAVLPTVIAQLAAGASRIKLGALTPLRDFTYVEDTVAGMMAVLDNPASIGEVINIGSGSEISVGDSVRLIAEVMGVICDVELDVARVRPEASEVMRLWADIGKAEALLGWKPAYSGVEGFRRGLQHTVAWFTDPANLATYKPDIYAV